VSTIIVDKLIKAYIACRDALNTHRHESKKVEDKYKGDMEIFANRLKELADEMGVESFKTEHGSAFKKVTDWISVDDWDLFNDFVIKNDLVQMFKKDANKAAIKEYMAENNNQLPPGIGYGQKVEIQVRRS